MDLSKYPLEKLLYFVAGVIPGFVALLTFQLAAPGSFGWFFTLGFLGYRTKLSLIVLACFVVGYSMTTILKGLLGAIGGIPGTVIALRSYKPSYSYHVAPWRDSIWRRLVKNRLGATAPDDTQLISQQILDLRRKMLEHLPEEQRAAVLIDLNREKLKAEVDDGEWSRWYDHYHQIVLQPELRDFVSHVQTGLNLNLETAALFVLVSATVVPGLRHWWCILPACMWVLMLVAEVFSAWRRFTDRWLTLSDQIKYLAGEGEDRGGPRRVPETTQNRAT
jgi:hypothetical protein